jgi:hypothetical protein
MPRVTRQARNQALFREVNERIAELLTRLDGEASTQSFICECAHTGCTDMINVPLSTYSRVRDDPTLFLIAAGHQDLSHEEVVEDHGAYLIAKTNPGVASQVAVDTA